MADNEQELTFVPEEEVQKQALAESAGKDEVQILEEGIKNDLEEIKHLTGDSRSWFFRGIMQGAGAIVGSIAMLIFLGWFLSIVGIIPGFGEISTAIQPYLDSVRR